MRVLSRSLVCLALLGVPPVWADGRVLLRAGHVLDVRTGKEAAARSMPPI